MNKNKKLVGGFLLGVIFTLFILLPLQANLGKSIEVIPGIKIKIGGEEFIPRDVNGKKVEVFLYQGTTYLPVRAISQAFNKSIQWDEKNKTVLIGKEGATSTNSGSQKETYMGNGIEYIAYGQYSDFKYYYGEGKDQADTLEDNIGNKYQNYLRQRIYSSMSKKNEGFIEFPTLKKYKKFKGTIGIIGDEFKSFQGQVEYKIFADGKEVYSKTIKAGDFPEDIEVNIENADKVKFYLSLQNKESISYGVANIAIFNPRFTE